MEIGVPANYHEVRVLSLFALDDFETREADFFFQRFAADDVRLQAVDVAVCRFYML